MKLSLKAVLSMNNIVVMIVHAAGLWVYAFYHESQKLDL